MLFAYIVDIVKNSLLCLIAYMCIIQNVLIHSQWERELWGLFNVLCVIRQAPFLLILGGELVFYGKIDKSNFSPFFIASAPILVSLFVRREVVEMNGIS